MTHQIVLANKNTYKGTVRNRKEELRERVGRDGHMEEQTMISGSNTTRAALTSYQEI